MSDDLKWMVPSMTFDLCSDTLEAATAMTQAPPARSRGTLSPETVQRSRRADVPLAFDPAQLGWVPEAAEDDLGAPEALPRAHAHGPADRALTLGDYRLRPWRPEEAARLATLLGDAEVWRHLPERFAGTLDAAAAAELITLANAAPRDTVLAVEHAGAPIGQIRLQFTTDGREAELSYWFGRAHWGMGHAGRVVPAFADSLAKRHPGLARLTARVHVENPASAHVLARAGFTEDPATDRQAPDWRVYSRTLV